jgi:hypothetical protein
VSPRPRPIRTLLVYALDLGSATLSYQQGWPSQFARHPAFDCTALDLTSRSSVARARVSLALGRPRFDLVVLLHSVFSNELALHGALRERIAGLDSPKVYFIGNEYKLMPEKMSLAEEVGIALLVSQSESPEIQRLYRERLGCEVTGLPNTGLDPDLFRPRTPWHERPIDVGYRAYDAPWYLGHRERLEIAVAGEQAAERLGLRSDISLDPADRFAPAEWAVFLDSCRGQLGCEAGGDYFELEDSTRTAVNAYCAAHPEAPFDDVHGRFFSGYGPRVSGRMLSGRIVEAAGTKTAQILLEGEYDGYFDAGVHYIPLRKDYANVDEALAQLRDEELCRRITDAAYAVATERLTFTRLLDRFAADVRAILDVR